jgi:phosphoserine aminotransferase
MADSSTLAAPRYVSLRRVLPKQTPKAGAYPGNARNFVRCHWNETVTGVAYPVVAGFELSRVVTLDTSKVEEMRSRMAALILSSSLDAFFEALSLPS